MRLATVRTTEGTRAARIEGDRLLLLRAPDVGALFTSMNPASQRDTVADLETTGSVLFADASFAPLVPHPEKIFCVGMNYRAHILEMSREFPSYPTLFAKFASSVRTMISSCRRSPTQSTGRLSWASSSVVASAARTSSRLATQLPGTRSSTTCPCATGKPGRRNTCRARPLTLRLRSVLFW